MSIELERRRLLSAGDGQTFVLLSDLAVRRISWEAVAAAEAGASIVHLHARKPENGEPSQDPALFHAFLPAIAARSDVVINLTTGGAPNMLVEGQFRTFAKTCFRVTQGRADCLGSESSCGLVDSAHGECASEAFIHQAP
jgi:hypothetical protein